MPKYAYIRSSEYGGIHQINRDVGASKQIHGIRTVGFRSILSTAKVQATSM